ncbi:MAG: hypothetical protein HUK21_09720 [Fibrobacteraceae bacterium]|nr:hypothetical protein [Fibrobacteraceae bacterium]
MKFSFILSVLLFRTIVFSSAWEANLEQCQDFGGFWFPGHPLAEKSEPWIKPFPNGGSLEDFGETGMSFNYDMPGWSCSPSLEEECIAVENTFNIRITQPVTRSDLEDSIFFFFKCEFDSLGNKVSEKNFSLENLAIENFKQAKNNNMNYFTIDSTIFSLNDFCYEICNYRTGVFFIYKKYSNKFEYNALCNISLKDFSYKIQCEFQDDGSLNFNKIPDANSIPDNFCSTYTSLKIQSKKKLKTNILNQGVYYKINGALLIKGSSNIIINNKQPKLQLKRRPLK